MLKNLGTSMNNMLKKDKRPNDDDSIRDLKAMFQILEQEEGIRDEMAKIEEEEIGFNPNGAGE